MSQSITDEIVKAIGYDTWADAGDEPYSYEFSAAQFDRFLKVLELAISQRDEQIKITSEAGVNVVFVKEGCNKQLLLAAGNGGVG